MKKSKAFNLLRRVLAKNAPNELHLADLFSQDNLPCSKVEKLCEIINDEFLSDEINEDFSPNE